MGETIIRKLLGPMGGLLLCFATAPAFAGEWVETVSFQEGWNAIVYRGNFNQGEFATLYYRSSGSKTSFDDTRRQHYRLVMVLNNDEATITGFTGVALFSMNAHSADESLLTLSRGPHYSFGELQGSYDVANGGRAVSPSHEPDFHACFRTRADLQEGTRSVRCDSGEGHWILVEAAGSLKEETRPANDAAGLSPREVFKRAVSDIVTGSTGGRPKFYSPGPAIRAANMLVIGARSAEYALAEYKSFNLTIDERFRNALWDEALWKKK